MRLPEVGKLLTHISMFDNRTLDHEGTQAKAWFSLPWVQAADYEIAMEAVVLFFSEKPDQYGNTPYMDTRWLGYYYVQAKKNRERNQAKERALRALPPGTASDPKPDDFDEQVAAANRAKLAEMMRKP